MRELGGATPLETCLAEAREAGFSGVELGHKFPRDPLLLSQVLARFGLALVSGWYSSALLQRTPEAEMQVLRPHLDLLKALGCTVLIFAETSNAVHTDRRKPLAERPVMPDHSWTKFAQRVTAVAARTWAEGRRPGHHLPGGSVVKGGRDSAAVRTRPGGPVLLLPAAGPAPAGGAARGMLARRWRSRISHVHAKDVRREVMERARAERLSFLDAVVAGMFTVPGDGCVDYSTVLRELAGYSGWIVVEAEQDPAQAHPLTYARMGYR